MNSVFVGVLPRVIHCVNFPAFVRLSRHVYTDIMSACYDLGYLPEPRGHCEDKGATGSTDGTERRRNVVDDAAAGLPGAMCAYRVAVRLGTPDRRRRANAADRTVSSRSGSVSSRGAVASPHGAARVAAGHAAARDTIVTTVTRRPARLSRSVRHCVFRVFPTRIQIRSSVRSGCRTCQSRAT